MLTVIVSGLTDSNGIYQNVGDSEKELAQQWLGLTGFQEKWNSPFKSLSIGEQRLVLIARSLIKQTTLLILDEPIQGLDDFNRFYVLSIVEKILAKWTNNSSVGISSPRRNTSLYSADTIILAYS